MQVVVQPKRRRASVGDTDAFCGPCFHYAIEHNGFDSTASLCWECPGAKSDFDENNVYGWWDRPEGDPSLEGFSCQVCKEDETGPRLRHKTPEWIIDAILGALTVREVNQ